MFAKLRKVNDWGSVRYEKVEPEHMSTVRVDLTGLALLRVRWPDGFEETLPLVHSSRVEQVNDMGHEYSVRSVETFAIVQQHGLSIRVPIEGFKVEF